MSDRLEREIEDIVEKAGSLPPPPRRSRRAPRPRPVDGTRRSILGGMRFAGLLGLVLLLVGAILWGTFGSLGSTLVLGGLLLLAVAALAYFRNGSSTTLPGGYEKRWRGQALTPRPESKASLWDRLRGRRGRRRG